MPEIKMRKPAAKWNEYKHQHTCQVCHRVNKWASSNPFDESKFCYYCFYKKMTGKDAR